MAIDEIALRQRTDRLGGSLVTATDADYDEARKLFNAMIDKQPAAIAYCESVDDVREALHCGLSNGVKIAAIIHESCTSTLRRG